MSGYPLLDIFWSMFIFFAWLLWIWLVVWVLMDIFRSRDISGWGKAGWVCLVIFLPLIGILAYEIVHSDHLFGRRDAYDTYPGDVRAQDVPAQSRGAGSASELSKLSDLHDRGVISDAEFARGKEKILQ
jgi:Short C-terminal domain/Phospholipase_D-nuclease N-terminal